MKEIDALYIHFPFCQHLCNYCDFYKHKLETHQQVLDFENKLSQQIVFHEEYLKNKGFTLGKLSSLYIGGGTPSLWKESGVKYLKNLFSFKENFEFTIEIDPDTWRESEIDQWLSLGVNRFSIGSQAYSKKYLKIMDRTHKLSDVEKSIKYFSDRKLNFSVDFMLGLPQSESSRDIIGELESVLKYKPCHFSVYILKTRSNYLHKNDLPSDEFVRSEFLKVSTFLVDCGYEHYEVSNFARDGKKSLHNQKYWNYESVAAIGPNATGLIVYSDKAMRYKWKSMALGVTEELLTGSSLIIEKLFLGIRQKNNFNFKSIFEDQKILDILSRLVQKWVDLNYAEKESHVEKLNLTALGYLMCDSLMDDIFREVKF